MPEPSAAQCSEEIAALTRAHLRVAYPYFKDAALEQVTEACAAFMKDQITAQEPIMAVTKSRAGFLKLSAELRNHIYRLVVRPSEDGEGGIYDNIDICVQEACVLTYSNERRERDWYALGKITRWTDQPALTKTCRQLRNESLPVYYGLNRFVVYDNPEDYDGNFDGELTKVKEWLKRIGAANAALMKYLDVYRLGGHTYRRDVFMCLNGSELGLSETAVVLYQTESGSEYDWAMDFMEGDWGDDWSDRWAERGKISSRLRP